MSGISNLHTGSPILSEQVEPLRKQVRVLIVHPNRLFREALAVAMACRRRTVRVVGCVAEASQLQDIVVQLALCPDVILLDGRASTPETLREAVRLLGVFGTAKVLIIGRSAAAQGPPPLRWRAIASEGRSLRGLLQMIRRLGRGQHIPRRVPDSGAVPPSVPAEQPTHESGSELMGITRREQEILTLRQKGLSNKEIAVALHIELQTVKNHLRSLFTKVQLKRQRRSLPSTVTHPFRRHAE